MTIEKLNELIEKNIVQKNEDNNSEIVEVIDKRRKKSRMYFTSETENAIILYNKVKDTRAKDIIYQRYIHIPIEKLVENIFNTFKFPYHDVPAADVQREVLSNLILNLHKYKAGKGKAFSYFSIVAKNYLIQMNTGNYNWYKKSSLLSTMPDSWEVPDDFWVKERHKESAEFTELMLDFWNSHINSIFTKKRDIQIADSVLELFRQSEKIDNFNKKALYVYIREMTDCKTQYITKVIKTMKDINTAMLEEFRTTGNIDRMWEVYDIPFWERC